MQIGQRLQHVHAAEMLPPKASGALLSHFSTTANQRMPDVFLERLDADANDTASPLALMTTVTASNYAFCCVNFPFTASVPEPFWLHGSYQL